MKVRETWIMWVVSVFSGLWPNSVSILQISCSLLCNKDFRKKCQLIGNIFRFTMWRVTPGIRSIVVPHLVTIFGLAPLESSKLLFYVDVF